MPVTSRRDLRVQLESTRSTLLGLELRKEKIEGEIDIVQSGIDAAAEMHPMMGSEWRPGRVRVPTRCEHSEAEMADLNHQAERIRSDIDSAESDVSAAKTTLEGRPRSIADYICKIESIEKYGKTTGIDVTGLLDRTQTEWEFDESEGLTDAVCI